MRRGELLSLRWSDVDLRRRTAYLPSTKNGEARTVPLSTRAVAVLEALPESLDGRVFPTRRRYQKGV
jgi:integrase